MKHLTNVVLAIVLFMLGGCGQSNTPEAAAQRYILDSAARINNTPAQLENVQVHRTEPWQNGVVALYTAHDASSASSDHVGYIVLKRSLLRWQPKETGAIVRPTSVTPEGLVEYEVGGGHARNADYALVFGRILDPRVAAIEATFDTNETLRDEPTDDVFAVVAEGANAVCELRFLAPDGTVLQRDTPSSPQQQCSP